MVPKKERIEKECGKFEKMGWIAQNA